MFSSCLLRDAVTASSRGIPPDVTRRLLSRLGCPPWPPSQPARLLFLRGRRLWFAPKGFNNGTHQFLSQRRLIVYLLKIDLFPGLVEHVSGNCYQFTPWYIEPGAPFYQVSHLIQFKEDSTGNRERRAHNLLLIFYFLHVLIYPFTHLPVYSLTHPVLYTPVLTPYFVSQMRA